MTNAFNGEPINSYALEGTDLVLRSLLRKVRGGTYLDVGANHPHLLSNTFLFYGEGWRGVAVDGYDKFSGLWAELRPEDVFITALVSDFEKEVLFTVFPDDSMGSIDETTVGRYESRFEKSLVKTKTMKTTTIFDIWKARINQEVHLLSIDIEGEELNALKGANLDVFRPGIVAAESKNVSLYAVLSNELVSFMTNHGYRLIAKTPLDCIFVEPNKSYFDWIPASLLETTPRQSLP